MGCNSGMMRAQFGVLSLLPFNFKGKGLFLTIWWWPRSVSVNHVFTDRRCTIHILELLHPLCRVIQLRKSYKGSIGPDPMFLNCQSTSTRNGVATQNEFPQLEITNVAKQKTSTNTFQKSEIRNYHQNGVNLKNSQINSSLQDGVNNQELGRYYSLQKTPTLSSALKFHHKRTCISIKNNRKYSNFLKTIYRLRPQKKLEMIKSLYKFRNNFQKKKTQSFIKEK